MKYQVLENDRFKYVSLVLLNEIINFQHYFSVKPLGEEVFIEPYLRFMYEKGVLDIDKGRYVPTELGREELVTLYSKYYEYLKLYDIFCAVDLGSGEFAFSRISENMTDDEWFEFLEEERFSDVRVAVAEFKNLNPIEIVFMSFLNEGRFDNNHDRWEYELTGASVWGEIEEICNSAITMDYLMTDNVLEDVIIQGTEIALDLLKASQAANPPEDNYDEVEVVTEYVEIVEMPVYGYDYYDGYYDPYYVSPIWLAPVVLYW